MKNNKMYRYLGQEIGIEYKATLNFFAMAFFYCCYLVLHGIYDASILKLAELIFLNYIMGYAQLLLMKNFDEADHYTYKSFGYSLICSGIYAAASYGFDWFDRNLAVTGIFILYVLFMYFCMLIINKVKRDTDTWELNEMLTDFKEKERQEQNHE